jgi:oxygen-dependent protoporphyrinogen oxidase
VTDVDVCVVGGGIAGLAAAFDLADRGHRVAVFEQREDIGGMLSSGVVAGVRVDLGAESFATRTDAVPQLIADAGLGLRVVSPLAQPARIVHRRGESLSRDPLPVGTVLGIPGDLGAADLMRIVGSVLERPLPVPVDEPTLRALVAERLGDVLADTLVDTVCRGVYSAGADELRLSRVHPELWRLFSETGSLTAAVRALAPQAAPGSAVAGIDGGMWQLPVALGAAVRERGGVVRTGVRVDAVHDGDGDCEVHTSAGVVRARRVVIAGSVGGVVPQHPSSSSVPVRVALAAVTGPLWREDPTGPGALVAANAGLRAKALTHADAKWPWLRERLPAATQLVRVSAGDDGSWLGDPSALAAEITAVTGVSLAPTHIGDVRVVTWDSASGAPTDDPGPRIRLTGTAVAGTGLTAVVAHARRVAAEIAADLPRTRSAASTKETP